MRLPRIRLSIRGLLIGIAVSTVFTYYIAAPAWKYYRLPFETRQILGKLRTPMILPIGGAKIVMLQDLIKQIRLVTTERKGKELPIYIDPMGLQDADKTMASMCAATTDRMPIQEHLERALASLEMDYFIKDGLLTITSAKSARAILQDQTQDATHP